MRRIMDFYFHRRILLLFLLPTSPLVMSAELYRWVDGNGNVHYSDQVPPTQAERPRVELNAYGQAVREVNTVKTREQRLREQQELLEARQREREREKREAEDRALLTTFASVDEIELLYANRLRDIDSYTAANRRKLEKTRALLQKTIDKKAWYLSRDLKVPRQISDNIKEYEQQIATYELLISRNIAKRQKLEKSFARDKARFRMLTSGIDAGE